MGCLSSEEKAGYNLPGSFRASGKVIVNEHASPNYPWRLVDLLVPVSPAPGSPTRQAAIQPLLGLLPPQANAALSQTQAASLAHIADDADDFGFVRGFVMDGHSKGSFRFSLSSQFVVR